MKINIKKYISIIKSISIVTLICFLCCGCNVKDISFDVDKIKESIKKEEVFDIDSFISANTYKKLMESFGSIYITNKGYDINGEEVSVQDIYEDEKGNKAYREYHKDLGIELKDSIYDIKFNDEWYMATDEGYVGYRYDLTDEKMHNLEKYNGMELFNGDIGFINKEEYVIENYIDDNGDGIVKTSIGDFQKDAFKELYKIYGTDIGIEKLAKIITTYTYDVDTMAVTSSKSESIDEKGKSYPVYYSEVIYGDGNIPVMQKVEKYIDSIKNIDYIIENNTYDKIIKKYNSVSASVKLEREHANLLTYEIYGDFRGIKSFKSWDYTVNTTYSLAYTHIKDANGNWYKTNNGKDISNDNIITANEKYYYENYDPIQGIFNQKSILWDKNIAVKNVINGTMGHIIYETDKLTDILNGYRKSIISDLDREMSYIKADFTYDLADYIIDDIRIEVIDKNGNVDKRMMTIKLEYDVEAPEYSKALFYDKEFKLDYEKLVEANTEKKLLEKYKSIIIKDTRYKNAMLKDKEITLYKNADGDFMIQDDKGVVYLKDSAGFIYKKENKDIDIKTRVQNVKELDVYVRDAFDNNDIVSALYGDNTIKSIINENEKIVVCYNDLGKGRLITTNDDKTIRVEYIYDIADKTVEEISYYVIDNGKMNLKYITKIDKSGASVGF